MISIKRATTGELLMVLDSETLEGADLRGANLRGADLCGARLMDADLRGASLRGADLSASNLSGADLEGASLLLVNLRAANLQGAKLRGATLEGSVVSAADLCGADLTDANLFGTQFRSALYDETTRFPEGFSPREAGARFTSETESGFGEMRRVECPHCGAGVPWDARKCRECGKWIAGSVQRSGAELRIVGGGGQTVIKVRADTLQGIDLRERDLRGANLMDANLGGARFDGAKLSRAQFKGANLAGARLEGAAMGGANLFEANLVRASLAGADARGASFESAVLCRCDMSRAILREANLARADLRGADLREANLEGARLEGIIHDAATRWPEGFRPRRQGAPPAVPRRDRRRRQAGRALPRGLRECEACHEIVVADATRCRFCAQKLAPLPRTRTRRALVASLALLALAAGATYLLLRSR